MKKLSVEEIIAKIENEEEFEATSINNAFHIKINRYVPYVCTAIHAGHHFRDELKEKCFHTEYERWFEEDPHTDEFIASFPITIIGNDSRYEYDLNRDPENCIYDEAWGKKVWRKPLTKVERTKSLRKYYSYYHVIDALLKKLEDKFKACIVYDMHSYNYRRWTRKTPVFNIGCVLVDMNRFGKYVYHFNEELNKIEFREIESESAINDVFEGKGNNLAYITKNFKNTLVLATEVKKIYCDELTGKPFPEEIKYLKRQLKKAIINNASLFVGEQTNVKVTNKNKLLTKSLEKNVKDIDTKLRKSLKGFELLSYVNPINLVKAEKDFFKNKELVNPEFHYKPISIDPFKAKRSLYELPIDKIEDIALQNLYEAVVNSYVDKTDLIASIGKKKFLYNSLRYFGRPSEQDIKNANYLLSLPTIKGDQQVHKKLYVNDAKLAFQKSFEKYGFDGKIGVSKHMASDVMVVNSQRKVMIKENAEFSEKELNYLVHHEIGVHMVTTMNSLDQPIKIFNMGLPVNTKTQEGLAVLAEYLSGNTTLKRLRTLGLRVIAVDMMCDGVDFKETYHHLLSTYKEDKRYLFNLVARVYRGGGFTKDYLYLTGFTEIYKNWKQGYDLTPLLIGKTSIKFYNTIVELMDREIINRPKYITDCFEHPTPEKNHNIYEYIVDGLQ